jgi:hypothetical protein
VPQTPDVSRYFKNPYVGSMAYDVPVRSS